MSARRARRLHRPDRMMASSGRRLRAAVAVPACIAVRAAAAGFHDAPDHAARSHAWNCWSTRQVEARRDRPDHGAAAFASPHPDRQERDRATVIRRPLGRRVSKGSRSAPTTHQLQHPRSARRGMKLTGHKASTCCTQYRQSQGAAQAFHALGFEAAVTAGRMRPTSHRLLTPLSQPDHIKASRATIRRSRPMLAAAAEGKIKAQIERLLRCRAPPRRSLSNPRGRRKIVLDPTLTRDASRRQKTASPCGR